MYQKIRLPHESALIQTLIPCIVTWGIHNDICWYEVVSAGYMFNTFSMTGSWHDILPLTMGAVYRRVGPAISDEERQAHNKRNDITIKRIEVRED